MGLPDSKSVLNYIIHNYCTTPASISKSQRSEKPSSCMGQGSGDNLAMFNVTVSPEEVHLSCHRGLTRLPRFK